MEIWSTKVEAKDRYRFWLFHLAVERNNIDVQRNAGEFGSRCSEKINCVVIFGDYRIPEQNEHSE
jgi:hypothetical protein